MLRYFYEMILEARISLGRVPQCVAVVLSQGDLDGAGLETLGSLLGWSEAVGIHSMALYIGEEDAGLYQRITSRLSNAPAKVSLHTSDGVVDLGRGGKFKMTISLGFGGRKEVTEAMRKVLERVEDGSLQPEEIDESILESNLRFSQKPDLVIRAGGNRLSDFMIWQAAYSELYFTEVNWRSVRKVDFLRAIRDYQKRQRRFGA
jgi:undecaprenyl diphosphate synthase